MSHSTEPSPSGAPDLNRSPASFLEEAARADRARRIEAMLERWASEDCSDEPDWDVDEIEPLRLRVPIVEPEGERT